MQLRSFFNAALFVCSVISAQGAASITSPVVSLSENFDTLASGGTTTFVNNLTIPNWVSARTGSTDTIVANDGGSSTGNLHSYGINSNIDRAFGSLTSNNTGDVYYGWILQNNSGGPVNLSALLHR